MVSMSVAMSVLLMSSLEKPYSLSSMSIAFLIMAGTAIFAYAFATSASQFAYFAATFTINGIAFSTATAHLAFFMWEKMLPPLLSAGISSILREISS